MECAVEGKYQQNSSKKKTEEKLQGELPKNANPEFAEDSLLEDQLAILPYEEIIKGLKLEKDNEDLWMELGQEYAETYSDWPMFAFKGDAKNILRMAQSM